MTVKEVYRDFAEAKRKYNSAIAAYRNALPIKGGEWATVKETGETVVLCPPYVNEENGEWVINRCHKLKKDGTPNAYTTVILGVDDTEDRHVIVDGVEYLCGHQPAIEF